MIIMSNFQLYHQDNEPDYDRMATTNNGSTVMSRDYLCIDNMRDHLPDFYCHVCLQLMPVIEYKISNDNVVAICTQCNRILHIDNVIDYTIGSGTHGTMQL